MYHMNSSSDVLPYSYLHGRQHPKSLLKPCLPHKLGNETHKIINESGVTNDSLPVKNIHWFISDKDEVRGHLVYINNPQATVTALEPTGLPGGCAQRKRSTVAESGSKHRCEAAINAGFFNTHSGQCYGNLIVDGKVVVDSQGVLNAHFGILKNGDLFFGYLDESTLLHEKFKTLVGGVIWLLRNGKSFVNQSLKAECAATEETGPLRRFVDVKAARTAVGHDSSGRVVFAHVDGETDKSGVSLWEFADLLASFGLVNAINLDGGGSSTLVMDGTVVNYPSDVCRDTQQFRCARQVSTILCARPALRAPFIRRRLDYSGPIVIAVGLGLLATISLVANVYLCHVIRRRGDPERRRNRAKDWSLGFSPMNGLDGEQSAFLIASSLPSQAGSSDEEEVTGVGRGLASGAAR